MWSTSVTQNERRFKILMIEDSPEDSMFLKLAFDRHDDLIEVKPIFNGQDALKAIKGVPAANDESCPHLLVLDLGLPDISGEKLLQVKTSWGPTVAVPVVIFTGRSETDDFVQKISSDPNILVLTKPDTRDGYDDAVAKILAHGVARLTRSKQRKVA